VFVSDLAQHNIRCFDTRTWDTEHFIGRKGSNLNEFDIPSSVECLEVDSRKFLLTAEIRNQRIQIIDIDTKENIICTYGGMGSKPGQFHFPVSIATHFPTIFQRQQNEILLQRHERISENKLLGTVFNPESFIPAWFIGKGSEADIVAQIIENPYPGKIRVSRQEDSSAKGVFDIAYMIDFISYRTDVIRTNPRGKVYLDSLAGVSASVNSVWDLLKQIPGIKRVRVAYCRTGYKSCHEIYVANI